MPGRHLNLKKTLIKIMPSQILQTRIQSLTPEYSDFVFSDFTSEAIRSIQSAGFENFDNQVLENGIFLYLTLFLHKFALIEFIITECHKSINEARQITDIIIMMMPEEMIEQQSNTTVALDITAELVKEKDRFAIINSNENLLNRYLYLKTSHLTEKLIKKYLILNSELVDQFKIVISDITLGFYKKEDTVPLLQQELELDAKTAALLGADVLDFLAPLSDPNWQPPVEEAADDLTDVGISSFSAPLTVGNVVETAQIVREPELPTLRTMAADMAEERSPVRNTFNAAASIDEPVYISTQPTIEKKAPDAPSYSSPLYQTPKPNIEAPLEKPRWG